MSAPSNKQKILAAAASVTERHGAANLTLDRVAEAARLSKGGLLYHFPSKRALLEGMLEHLLALMNDRLKLIAVTDATPATQLSGLIEALTQQTKAERAMTQALLAAAAEDPALLENARDQFAAWLHHSEQLSPYGAVLVLAAEGLLLLDLLGLLKNDAERERLSTLLGKTASDWS